MNIEQIERGATMSEDSFAQFNHNQEYRKKMKMKNVKTTN